MAARFAHIKAEIGAKHILSIYESMLDVALGIALMAIVGGILMKFPETGRFGDCFPN